MFCHFNLSGGAFFLRIKHSEHDQESYEDMGCNAAAAQFLFWFLSITYLESLVHYTVYDGFHIAIIAA